MAIPEMTKLVIIIATLLLILYDAYAIWFGGQQAAISTVIWEASMNNPIIPFAVGCLCGHLFWRE